MRPSSLGMGPLKRLLERSNLSRNSRSRPSSVGIVPSNKLLASERVRSSNKRPIDVVSVPMMALLDTVDKQRERTVMRRMAAKLD